VHRDAELRRIERFRLIRPATRREVYRRISLATDFLHSNYARQISLNELAAAACISKYHFLRLFQLVHRVTPHQYLMRKRSQVAWRLLQTQLSIEEVAFRVGFAQRTLLRQLRRWTGHSPAELRRTLTLATSVGSIASSVQPPL